MSDCSIDSPAPGHLTVRGDLDFDNAPAALAHGLALLGDAKECEIDLSGLRSGDSAGLAVLIEWLASALAAGRDPALHGSSGPDAGHRADLGARGSAE